MNYKTFKNKVQKELRQEYKMTAAEKRTVTRLENDAEALFSPPPKLCKLKYDQGDYGTHKKPHAPAEKNYCGTTACAAGHIALSGYSGLQAKWVPEKVFDHDKQKFVPGEIMTLEYGFNGKWSDKSSHSSILEQYYGIDTSEEDSLFGGSATNYDGKRGRMEIATKMLKLAEFIRQGRREDYLYD